MMKIYHEAGTEAANTAWLHLTHHNVDEKKEQDEDYDESIVDKIDEKRGMKIRGGNYGDDEDDEDDEDEDDEDEDEEDDKDDEDTATTMIAKHLYQATAFNWNEMEKFADELEQVEVCFILPHSSILLCKESLRHYLCRAKTIWRRTD